ncbi:MAG: hypothetical protein QOJ99_2500 [Bryobacterales bacterium]|nr:hypothetical protein [Bryobacterales bacterium]
MRAGRDSGQKVGRDCRGQEPCLLQKKLAVIAGQPPGLIQPLLESVARPLAVEYRLHAGNSQQGCSAHRRFGSLGLLAGAGEEIFRHECSLTDSD